VKFQGKSKKPLTDLYQNRLLYFSTARLRWQGVLFSFLSVAVATLILFLLNEAPYNVNMVFMFLTLISTVWFGLMTGFLTAVLSFFCFDFFFIPPFFTLVIDALQGWTAVLLFFGTALFANQVAGRARISSFHAQQHALEATALYELGTEVLTRIDQREMLLVVLRKVSEILKAQHCTLYLLDEGVEGKLLESAMIELPSYHNNPHRHPDPAIAQTVFQQNRVAYFPVQSNFQSDSSRQHNDGLVDETAPVAYLPLTYGSQVMGVMVTVGRDRDEQLNFSVEENRLIQVFANHVALAVEHARLIRESAQVATLRDSDQLKSSLLASVSHELRTPLTSITTAVANLELYDEPQLGTDYHETLNIIEQETERLDRLVTNLLDLSKIEAHALKPDFGWYYLPEIVQKVLERLNKNPLLKSHPVITTFTPDLPLAHVDYLQLDQALTNLIENAAKYSAPNRPITITVELQACVEVKLPSGQTLDSGISSTQVILVKVLDEGRGIPPGELERIFDKFYRVRTNQNGLVMDVPGTGIGLAITRGIIEAHGGRVWAQNRLYGGSNFTFALPVEPIAEDFEEE